MRAWHTPINIINIFCMKNIIIVILLLIILGGGSYYYMNMRGSDMVVNEPTESASTGDQMATSTESAVEDSSKTVIGKSVEGNDIVAYHYGEGDDELLFIGGIHGGYSWNTALVAYDLMDYLEKSSSTIPTNVKVTVIPVLNPDGLKKVVGTTERFAASTAPKSDDLTVPGRFNAHTVDLNRNFDCDWKESGTWQSKTVSGGTAAFSEPESAALRDYVAAHTPTAVVAWYAAAGGVYASNCHEGVSSATQSLTNVYAKASGYAAHEQFDFYAITGDMMNWFAKENIPAVSVLLTNHTDTEWSKNQKGIEAVLAHYAQ
jgi:hypothetical protein